MTIGNKYISDLGISDSLEEKENIVYLSMYFEQSFLLREDIVYLPCLIQSYSYRLYLTDYPNYNKFQLLHEQFKAELRVLQTCKIPASSFMEFSNMSIIENFYQEYKNACLYLYEKNKELKDYEYLAKAFILSEYIMGNSLIYKNLPVKISFNPFTDYGRYGLNAASFNILSLAKEKRYDLVAAQNYEFFEFDFNAFEIRVLLAILGISQPKGDLYEVLHNMSDDFRQRDQFKQFLISSIYSKNEHKTVLWNVLKNKQFYSKYPIIDGKVTNIFGKVMSTDEYHLLSRILQSTAAYILFNQMYELLLYLKKNNLKSKISFCIHDSICLSVYKDEVEHIQKFKNILTSIKLESINYESELQLKIKKGSNYGDMKIYET